jgi:hypothetical protein
VVTELKIGISQMLWIKKDALTFISLTEWCNICSGQSSHHPCQSIAGSIMDSCFSSESEKPLCRRKKINSSFLQKKLKAAHLEPLPHPLPYNQLSISVQEKDNQLFLVDSDYDYISAPLYNNNPGTIPYIWFFDSTGAIIILEI